jgi:UDP-N-acetylmuramoyl-tripeptide--D-alanyl-D-alanine ligase
MKIDISTILNVNSIVRIDGYTEKKFVSLSTDSRDILPGDIFLAIVGEKFDGFDYVADVLKKNVLGIIYNATPENVRKVEELKKDYNDKIFIGVEDSLKYLQKLAKKHLKKWKKQESNLLQSKKVIGITGSNGKTTHKEMLLHLLESVHPGKIHATQGNYNNHIGVPLTLLGLEESHEVAIVELGTNHPGEIKFLCKLTKPSMGIITNIGPAHLEFFKTEKDVFAEKRSLFDYVQKKSKEDDINFIVNDDDLFLRKLINDKHVRSFGENSSNINIQIDSESISGKVDDANIEITNTNIIGSHNLKNLFCSFLMARELFPASSEKFQSAAQSFMPKSNRSEWIEDDKQRFFLDAYNANPGSMKAALDAFADKCHGLGAKEEEILFVLGDMNELGDSAVLAHKDVGTYLKALGVVNVLFVGRYAVHYADGFKSDSKTYKNVDDLKANWPEFLKEFKYFFLKGSRSLQLESLMDIKVSL